MNLVPKLVVIACVAFAMQSCAPRPIDTGLVAAIAPKTPSEGTLSGSLLAECFAAPPDITKDVGPAAQATYSSGATYKLADRMKRSAVEIQPYADKVRGYIYPYEASTLFGKRKVVRICYYGQTADGLIFIDSLISEPSGEVLKSDFAGAIASAYEKLRGKPFVFGERALIVMGVPQY